MDKTYSATHFINPKELQRPKHEIHFDSFIKPHNLDEFVSEIFEKKPYYVSNAEIGVTSFLGITEFENILWSLENEIPNKLSVTSREEEEIVAPRKTTNKDLFRWAIDQFKNGHTLCFEDIHDYIPSLAALVADATQQLHSQVSISACLKRSHGIEPLKKSLCINNIVILQTDGSSLWNLTAPKEKKTITENKCSNSTKICSTKHEYKLFPGDSLYIPKGWIYSTETPHYSLNLAITLLPNRYSDYIKFLIEVVSELDIEFRRSVPIEHEEKLENSFRSAIHKLISQAKSSKVQRLVQERINLSLAAKLRPIPGHHFKAIEATQNLTLDTVVEKPFGSVFALAERGNSVYLYVPGLGMVDERVTEPGGLTFPISASFLLRTIINTQTSFTARNLPSIYSEEVRVETIRTLAFEGALIIHSKIVHNISS